MNEAEIYSSSIRPALEKFCAFDRIENSAIPGMPDISYSYKHITGWIETKVLHYSKGEEYIWVQKFQPSWFSRRLKHAHPSTLWVLACDANKERVMLIRGDNLLCLERIPHVNMRHIRINIERDRVSLVSDGFTKPFWAQFRLLIEEGKSQA